MLCIGLLQSMCYLKATKEQTARSALLLAGMAGLEPAKCQSQSLVPYHLATPQYHRNILTQQKRAVNIYFCEYYGFY